MLALVLATALVTVPTAAAVHSMMDCQPGSCATQAEMTAMSCSMVAGPSAHVHQTGVAPRGDNRH
jgi:hypothetical protein